MRITERSLRGIGINNRSSKYKSPDYYAWLDAGIVYKWIGNYKFITVDAL